MMVSFFRSSFFSPFIPALILRRETSTGVVSILRLSTFISHVVLVMSSQS